MGKELDKDGLSVSQRLVTRVVDVADAVAGLLWASEGVLAYGHRLAGGSGIQANQITGQELLSRVRASWSPMHRRLLARHFRRQVEPPSKRREFSSTEIRLANLLLRHWSENVPKRRARARPDVLRLTCELLSDPESPSSLHIWRFYVALALRGVFNVEYSAESLTALRRAYDALVVRFGEQQRRRVVKNATNFERLLIDLMAFDGAISRSLTKTNAAAYYDGFRCPVGVRNGSRHFGRGNWPELFGEIPDFSRVLNLAFNQPTGVEGFDDVSAGFAAVPADYRSGSRGGGLVTLVAGPPGSGKTTLCLAISSNMAELGSTVLYVTTEETSEALRVKRSSLVQVLTSSLLPDVTGTQGHSSWTLFERKALNLDEIVDQIERQAAEADVGTAKIQRSSGGAGRLSSEEIRLHLVFPHVLVIDSLAVLIDSRVDKTEMRRALGDALNRLRRVGVCVFLVGGRNDGDDEGLAYLVDNVFTLDVGKDMNSETSAHPSRVLSVRKTRLHASMRGRHVFHLSRTKGCSVSPSLHAILKLYSPKMSATEDASEQRRDERAEVWHGGVAKESGSYEKSLSLHSPSHTLVYGCGSASKASFALFLAFLPRIRASHEKDRDGEKARWRQRARVLVVSFLYGKEYYARLAKTVVAAASGFGGRQEGLDSALTVLPFYPGFLDAETLVGRIRRRLIGAKLEGRPYTGVVLDGIHNLLVQFPGLQHETLLWPTLFRILNAKGVDTISTYTFFRIAGLGMRPRKEEGDPSRTAGRRSIGELGPRIVRAPAPMNEQIRTSPSSFDDQCPVLGGLPSQAIVDRAHLGSGGVDHLFFQLLVSKCDYSFVMERDETPAGEKLDQARVRLTDTADGFSKAPPELVWNPATLRLGLPVRR